MSMPSSSDEVQTSALMLAGLEEFFDLAALRGGERAVVGAGDGFAGELVEGSGEALGDAAGVDEDEGGGALADDLEQARVDALPDAGALGALRGGAAGHVLDLAEPGHVFDGDFDAEVEDFARAGVDDGDGAEAGAGSASSASSRPATSHQVAGDSPSMSATSCVAWARVRLRLRLRLRRGSGLLLPAGAGWRRGRCAGWRPVCDEGFEALERERHVRAALGGDEGVDLVDDDGLDGAEGFAGLAR